MLKQYKDSYDVEVSQGEVRRETIDKYVDFLFSETSAKFRQLPMIDDATKDGAIHFWKKNLNVVKDYMMQMLTNKGVRIKL